MAIKIYPGPMSAGVKRNQTIGLMKIRQRAKICHPLVNLKKMS